MTVQSETLVADDGTEEIDLLVIVSKLWEGKWTVGLWAAAAFGLSVFMVLNTQPTYRADALLQLEEKASANPFADGLGLIDSTPRSATEIELLNSRLIMGQAVAEQNLDWQAAPRHMPSVGYFYSNIAGILPEIDAFRAFARSDEEIRLDFLQVPPGLLGQELIITKTSATGYRITLPGGQSFPAEVGVQFHDPGTGVTLDIARLTGAVGREFIVSQQSEEDTIKSARASLGVSESGRNSGVLNVTYESSDKETASRVLGAIVNAYLRQNISRDSAEAENSLIFIEERLPEVRAIVDQAEAALRQLQSDKNTLDLAFETQVLLEQQNLVEAELAALEIEEESLRRRYTLNHPSYKTLILKKEQLETKLASLQEKSLELPETQQEILDVTQQLSLARETYSKLMIRAQELRVVKASTIGNVRVIDWPQTASRPVAPRKRAVVMLGTVLGLIFGVGVVLVRAATAQGITSSGEIERSGFSVFAVVNKVRNEAFIHRNRKAAKWPVLAIEDPTELAVEAFRGLRTSLRFGLLDKDINVVAITSANPEAGKSFCAVNLAVVSAQSNQKVCLIDADMRRGSLRKFFGQAKNEPGLADYLSGAAGLEEVEKETGVDGLSFIPTGKYPPNPADLLLLPAFNTLLDDLSKRFDLVVVDCPPVMAVTDPVVISRTAGVTLLVALFGVTSKRELEAVKREIKAAGGRISGAIFNGYQQSKSRKDVRYDYRYAYK